MSIRQIARELGISRNTVRRYLRAPEVLRPAPRPPRGSKLDPYKEFILQRLAEGVDNCVVLPRELRAQGYTGGYTILKDFVQPLRKRRTAQATVRFETAPGEQAQVDFGSCPYVQPDGTVRRLWLFTMVLSWSRALYVEFVPRADTPTFIRCHLHAFAYFGGIVEHCLYDRTKLVVLGLAETGEVQWNAQFLDFALRLGFGIRLCQGYRPQTKGRAESGIKYTKRNFWPGVRFTDLDDLNRRARVWLDTVANVRIHGTTRERPVDRLAVERASLRPLPGRERLQPWLREERRVGRDGYVHWDGAWYGLPWPWRPGQVVQVQSGDGIVELWVGDERVAVHPRATRPGQRLTHPRQWAGIPTRDGRPRPEPVAVQLPSVEVERRPLSVYETLAGAVSRP
jgi:transposase